MRWLRCLPLLSLAAAASLPSLRTPVWAAAAQFQAARYALPPAERQELAAGRDRLRQSLRDLAEQSRRTGTPRAEQLPDAELYLEAVDRNLRLGLFFTARDVEYARAALQEGETRAASLRQGRAPWESRKGAVVLGYRSAVDGSVQPYQVYVPESYRPAAPRPGPLHIFLHGRGGVLTELNFVNSSTWMTSYFGTPEQPTLVLYPYGRGNNGWRWAGERDLFEALADLRRRFAVDENQVWLRGFSMGGHGTWHIGLQHPGRWAAMSPGAGFVETKVYRGITAPLPAWQEPLLHMYDPLDYAANAAAVPVLAYVGDQDPAIGQHQLMMAALRKEGVPFREFIGPNTPHRYEPRVRAAMLEELVRHRRPESPERVDFMTYTLRFPQCRWVRLEGLERHWERAEVHLRRTPGGVEGTTRNVSALRLELPAGRVEARMDGDTVRAEVKAGEPLELVKRNGRWTAGAPRGLRKRPGLQGPIDDALFGPVLAVSGSGKAWSEPLGRWTGLELARFRAGWDEYFRAALPERTDAALTDAERKSHNLYLFGDPGSNAVLRRLLPKLPLRWTKDRFTLAGRDYSPREHLPMLVFPHPENPERYVVINSGFTFARADWDGSNALQYAHLPDWAVVRFDADRFADNRHADTVRAGFFDERWRVREEAVP